MTPLEILLVVMGIVIVVLSYIISEKVTEKSEDIKHDNIMQSSEEEILELNKRVKEILDEKAENAVVKTDDQLSQISNEKIMAINEFSDQVLEKIDQNHKEVVFMYNMLSEKEKELKKSLNKISIQSDVEKEVSQKKVDVDKNRKKVNNTVNGQAEKIKKIREVKSAKNKDEIPIIDETKSIETFGENNNDQILKLYSEGKSQLEISKTLGLGQGEVKLVLDLFRGVKK